MNSSLNQTTTFAMQSFSRTGSSFGSPSFGSPGSSFSSPFNDPFRSTGSFSLSYREVTRPGLGTTTTLLSGALPPPARLITPQTPFLDAFQQTGQAMLAFEQGVRGFWGGLSPNVTIDMVALGGDVIRRFSGSPGLARVAHSFGVGASVAGTIYTFRQWRAGNAEWYDVGVSIATTALGFVPGAPGLLAGSGQLVYDLLIERVRP